jgi:hypothetical protein
VIVEETVATDRREYLYFTEEHELLRATIKRFCGDEIARHTNDWQDAGRGNDGHLVWHVLHVGFGRGPHHRFRVDLPQTERLLHHRTALKIVTTAVAPDPPKFCASPRS